LSNSIITSFFEWTFYSKKFFDIFVQESLTLIKELEKIEQSGNEILREYLGRCII